ncbi:UDP-N-acetylglucosamine--N-acetylmuramyl-(pentapeptide) pyrophosphoryl-undecaprenol N-acetylglucosamine transferase [Patescibacteria group bacterium]|nr:UDP-N-acetylglucosamine--N-acetylmuramyl-(pentapeptide) pyrophosphoryl-undecaprenol N-acetylglucosamine transferase [Patescibacteria group bacterium]
MKIILVGGGTGGSVAPLIAIAKQIKKINFRAEFLFVGTKQGIPEKQMVGFVDIPYKSIFSGKLRRYFSFKNIIDPFFIIMGFIQSIFIILKYKPVIILSAGGFVAVPLSWAGWLLRKQIFIHQQDVLPGLANKLISLIATKITVSLDKSLNDFNNKKTVLTGNPVRDFILQGSKDKAIEFFNLKNDLPVLLVISGGTGSDKINRTIFTAVPELTKFCQIIHITGKKYDKIPYHSNYHQYKFLNKQMPDAYAGADLIISRAGMGVLTEVSVLAKPVIIIPIPNSHQENNAEYFFNKNAGWLLPQSKLSANAITDKVRSLLSAKEELFLKSRNIAKINNSQSSRKIAELILKTYAQKKN